MKARPYGERARRRAKRGARVLPEGRLPCLLSNCAAGVSGNAAHSASSIRQRGFCPPSGLCIEVTLALPVPTKAERPGLICGIEKS